MTKRKPLIHDSFMPWPYYQEYGMVKAPRKKRTPKPKKTKSEIVSEWAHAHGVPVIDIKLADHHKPEDFVGWLINPEE